MNTVPSPSRVDWVDRQVLAGEDFRSALAYLDARRARHVRGAHGTWGVAIGLDVQADLKTSPRVATVTTGLAYDASGRELLVEGRREVAIPGEASGTVTVTLTSDGPPPGARLRIASADRPLRRGREVPLATLELGTGRLDRSSRPHARSMAPPRVAGWHVAEGAAPATGSTWAHTITVDTSAAGFVTTPIYLVQQALAGSAAARPVGLLGPVLDLLDAAPTRFLIAVRFLAGTADAASAVATLSRQVVANPLAFDWVGLEPAPAAGIPPTDF